MKLAYTICSSDTRGQHLAYQGDLKEMLARLREIGYQGVELFVRDPREVDQGELAGLLERNGLELVAIGTGPMAAEDKLSFTAADDRVRAEALERMKVAIDMAAKFGASVNVGKLRGNIAKDDGGKSQRLRDEMFKTVCDYAATKGVAITLEPQCRFSVNNLNTTQEALAWLKQQQLPQLYLMLDVFHMNVEDRSFAASFIDAKDYTIHIHLAENHRGAPGTGMLNFVEIIRVLKALGYQRYLSMEIEQSPDCYTAAQQAYHYVQQLIESL